MTLDPPFWFRQRQAKAEEIQQGSYKVSGPNLPEAVVSIRMGDDLRWHGFLQAKRDGPEMATTTAFQTAKEALSAAFDLYRTNMIV